MRLQEVLFGWHETSNTLHLALNIAKYRKEKKVDGGGEGQGRCVITGILIVLSVGILFCKRG